MGRHQQLGELAVGDQLGTYVIRGILGHGALGPLYLAHDKTAPVALRVLKSRLTQDPAYVERLRLEVEQGRAIRHPDLINVRSLEELDPRLVLVSRFVPDAVSLRERLAIDPPLERGEVARVICPVASGLAALHASSLVHRDVKPSNILVTPSRSFLSDFGAAKSSAYTNVTTTIASVFGDVDYVSPEVLRGEAAGPETDVYALACVTYECLAGQPPFGGGTPFEVPLAHLGQDPPDVRLLRPEVPSGTADLLRIALAKKPDQRPTAEVFREGLAASVASR